MKLKVNSSLTQPFVGWQSLSSRISYFSFLSIYPGEDLCFRGFINNMALGEHMEIIICNSTLEPTKKLTLGKINNLKWYYWLASILHLCGSNFHAPLICGAQFITYQYVSSYFFILGSLQVSSTLLAIFIFLWRVSATTGCSSTYYTEDIHTHNLLLYTEVPK